MPVLRAIIFLIVLSVSIVYSQGTSSSRKDDLNRYFQFDDPHPLACLFTYFPSIFIQHEFELKSFVSSKTFKHLREQFGDAKSVDAIYIRAMQLTNNNTAISLLLSTFATFDHETVGLKVPIFSLAFPLTDESRAEFARRVANLPRIIYDDSPEYGDRDKLQHFFGSAFIAFISESRDAADRFGVFVEKGEPLIVVGGVYDDRDLRADWQGQNFGSALLDNNHRRPTEFLARYPALLKAKTIKKNEPVGQGHCELSSQVPFEQRTGRDDNVAISSRQYTLKPYNLTGGNIYNFFDPAIKALQYSSEGP
jgi:hypothetical protein